MGFCSLTPRSARNITQRSSPAAFQLPAAPLCLPCSDLNLSSLQYSALARAKHALSSSDLVSEGCMLPEAAALAPPAWPLPAGSSGGLLESAGTGSRSSAAETASGSGSGPPKEGGSACRAALPLHASDAYGLAAGVTSVGPVSAAQELQDNSRTELPSPFSIASASEQDREGEAGRGRWPWSGQAQNRQAGSLKVHCNLHGSAMHRYRFVRNVYHYGCSPPSLLHVLLMANSSGFRRPLQWTNFSPNSSPLAPRAWRKHA